MSEEQIVGKIARIEVHVECGGCGKPFSVDLDPADHVTPGWTLFDEAVDAVRGVETSVQGGYLLCPECTNKIDAHITEDRRATAKECADFFHTLAHEQALK